MREFERIGEKVPQNLLDVGRIAENRRRQDSAHAGGQRDLQGIRFRAEFIHGFGHNFIEIEVLALQRNGIGFASGQIQDVIGDVQQRFR